MLLSFFDKNSLRKTKLVPGREIEHKSLSMQLNLPLLLLNEFSANFQVKLSWTLNFYRDWCAFQFSNTFFSNWLPITTISILNSDPWRKKFHFFICAIFDVPIGVKLHPCFEKKIIITLWNPACYVGKIDQLNLGMIRLGRNKPNLRLILLSILE